MQTKNIDNTSKRKTKKRKITMLKKVLILFVALSSFVFAATNDEIVCEEIDWSTVKLERLKESVKVKCGKEICKSVNANRHPAYTEAYCSCVYSINLSYTYPKHIPINFKDRSFYQVDCAPQGAKAERKYKERNQ